MRELNESVSKSLQYSDNAFQAYEEKLNSSAKKIHDQVRTRSGSRSNHVRRHGSGGSGKDYVPLRNHNLSKDFTM